MASCRCTECGFTAPPEDFDDCISAYHDMRCPECGTTAVDTSELNREWAAQGRRYGYGDDNFLIRG